MNEIIKRAKASTPKFFKVLRTLGITLAAVGGVIVASPVALPAAIVSVAGYLAVAGSVAAAVSQTTQEPE